LPGYNINTIEIVDVRLSRSSIGLAWLAIIRFKCSSAYDRGRNYALDFLYNRYAHDDEQAPVVCAIQQKQKPCSVKFPNGKCIDSGGY
jgi:hypothetical protein